MKRVLAGLLCATMFLGLVGTPTTTYAQEPTQIISEADTPSDESGLGSSEEETVLEDDGNGTSENPSGSEVKPSDGDEGGQGDEQQPSDEEGKEKSDEHGEDPADEPTEVVDPDELPEEAVEGDTELTDEELLEDALGGAKIIVPEEQELVGVTKSCFSWESDGTLKQVGDLATEVMIPKEVTRIPTGIFDTKSKCTRVVFEEGSQLTRIDARAFSKSSVEKIEGVPEGLTEIQDETFKSATALESFEFAKNSKITSIGQEAFAYTKIKSLDAAKVTTIGDMAFSNCSFLSNIQVDSLVSIGERAFSSCSALEKLNIKSSIRTIESHAFDSSGLKSIDIQNASGPVTLGDGCFWKCTQLTSVSLPNNLDVVPTEAFSGCSSLSSVKFGENSTKSQLTHISNNAFEGCSALKDLVFFNVDSFDEKAFSGCTAINTIYIWNNGEISFAEDSFPQRLVNAGAKIYGYDNSVKSYAQNRGYTFVSLYPTHKIDYAVDISKSATVKLSATEAVCGTKIEVTVAPASGYELKGIEINRSIPINKEDIHLVESTKAAQVFSFELPDADVTVDVKMASKGELVKGALTYSFEAVTRDGYTPKFKGEKNTFDITGRESKLVVTAGNDDTSNWLWTYASSNSKVATVSGTGVVRSVGVGTANITATLKSNTSVKISVPVKVDKLAEVAKIELKPFTNIPDAEKNVPNDVVEDEEGNPVSIPVIQFNKDALSTTGITFDVSIIAEASDENIDSDTDKSLTANTVWSSADKGIATLARTNVSDNKNTIRVNKGVIGESLITVYALNDGEKTPSAANSKSFIVRVIDYTPRLINSTLSLDSNSKNGTRLDLVTVYNKEMTEDLQVYSKSVDKNGGVNYIKDDDLEISFEDEDGDGEGDYYIRSKHPSEPFARTYNGKTQLFIRGYYDNGSGSSNNSTFTIPIDKLTVTNKALNPAIKTSGKINLFYNSTADSSLAGEITVTQSLKDVEVEDVELVSTANFKKEGSEPQDTFKANFDIAKVDNTTFKITRTANDMTKVNNKNVVSGYIYIYYKGYPRTSPIKKPITVATCDSAPAYILNQTSATASAFSSDQEYEIKLLDKKTKSVIDLDTLDTTPVSGDIAGLGINSSKSTDDLFESIGSADVSEAAASDTIKLKVNGRPYKGRACVYVKMSTWTRQLEYTFNLNVSNALPAVKLSTGTATLNETYPSRGATINLTQNQKEARLLELGTVTYAGNKKFAADAQKIIDAMDISDPTAIKINFPALGEGETIAKTKYTFRFTPYITYDGDPVATKVLTFTVNLIKTNPSINLNNATFKLNANSPGIEEVSKAFVIGNLPTGVTGTIVTDDGDDQTPDLEIVPVKNEPRIGTIGEVRFTDDKATVKLLNNTNVAINAGKTFSYKVKNLKVKCAEDEIATIPDFTIRIALNKAATGIKVKQTGTINPVDPTSQLTYVATVSNIVSDVSSVVVRDQISTGNYFTSTTFDLIRDANDSKKVYLKVKPGVTLVNNKKYNIELAYKLTSVGDDKEYRAKFTVVPKQILPQINTSINAATLYAGQNKAKTINIKITKKNNAVNATLEKPKWDGKTPDNIKKAFRIDTFDPATGEVTLKLVNPSAIAQNATYNLNLETRYSKQAEGSVGNKFTVKVTVKK